MVGKMHQRLSYLVLMLTETLAFTFSHALLKTMIIFSFEWKNRFGQVGSCLNRLIVYFHNIKFL